MSLRAKQIAVLIGIAVAYGVAIPTSWLGTTPEIGFVEFFFELKALLPLLGMFLGFVAFLAYVLGWNPGQATLKWLRTYVVYPLLTTTAGLVGIGLTALVIIVACCVFLITFDSKPHPRIVDRMMRSDYDGAEKLIKAIPMGDRRRNELTAVNDALREKHFDTTQDPDKNLCRRRANYLKEVRSMFRSAWWLYLHQRARASCLDVLEDPRGAEAALLRSIALVRWLPNVDKRLATRALALLYFDRNSGSVLIPDNEERLRRVVALLAEDEDPSARRIQGNAYYVLGEYTKAAATWVDALATLGESENIERKKLHNNVALAYTKIAQYPSALEHANTGLAIRFDEGAEDQRREQIRLLATKGEVLVGVERCDDLVDVWTQREALKQQDLSPCTAMLDAKFRACRHEKLDLFSREKLIEALFKGIKLNSQNPSTSEEALERALKQAEVEFRSCYSGLTFDANAVRVALGIELPAKPSASP